MCGICGIFSRKGKHIDEDVLKKMNLKLIHRGPDEEGYFINKDIGIAMRRLSIIDLKTGKQPILNEDKSIVVVMNGEIYNYRELREILIKKGHFFKTASDTEVIVHLYEEHDLDLVKYLRGMFAFALWDGNKERLIVARDRIGKKPLYYYLDSENFVFSSELNSLLEFNTIKKEIDLTSISMFLTLQYIPSPKTIFKDIKKLEPATLMIIEREKTANYKYWTLEEKQINLNFNDAKQRLREIVFESTKLRMHADVDIGVFLSGGIDSSIVVGVMSNISGRTIKTFSIGFREKDYSEIDYARIVAKRYSTQHHEFIVEEEMTNILTDLVKHYGEPFADPSMLPTYFVAKITSGYVKVVLNGDGGDENFAGYQRYKFIKIINILKKIMPIYFTNVFLKIIGSIKEGDAPFNIIWKLRRSAQAFSNDIERSYINAISFFEPEVKNKILSDNFKMLLSSTEDPAVEYINDLFKKVHGDIIKRVCYVDINSYLANCLMTKMDMATMANSLEARSPFLDHNIVEFSFNLPSSYKLKNLETKYILKEAFSDILPQEIKRRGKMGFGIPLGKWFRGKLKETFEENCIKAGLINRNYFKKEEILRIWDEHQNYKRDHGYKLWTMLVLELWHKNFANDFRL